MNFFKIKLILILVAVNIVTGQKLPSVNFAYWFDKSIGKENLDINNGVLLNNYDRTQNSIDRYLISKFQNNTVIYENQKYDNVFLNYDMVNDQLIIQPLGKNDQRQVVLETEKVAQFSISDKIFVHISKISPDRYSFLGGYFEVKFADSMVSLYIKHTKYRKEVFSEGMPYDDFIITDSFVILYNSDFYEMNSKSEVLKIFPTKEKIINNFYNDNANLKANNLTDFMSKLFFTISDALKTANQ